MTDATLVRATAERLAEDGFFAPCDEWREPVIDQAAAGTPPDPDAHFTSCLACAASLDALQRALTRDAERPRPGRRITLRRRAAALVSLGLASVAVAWIVAGEPDEPARVSAAPSSPAGERPSPSPGARTGSDRRARRRAARHRAWARTRAERRRELARQRAEHRRARERRRSRARRRAAARNRPPAVNAPTPPPPLVPTPAPPQPAPAAPPAPVTAPPDAGRADPPPERRPRPPEPGFSLDLED